MGFGNEYAILNNKNGPFYYKLMLIYFNVLLQVNVDIYQYFIVNNKTLLQVNVDIYQCFIVNNV